MQTRRLFGVSVVSVIQVTDISVTPYCGAVLTLSLPRLRVVTRKATSENAKLEITKIFFFLSFACARERTSHTPSTAFRHLRPRKDIVNQCLEFEEFYQNSQY